MSSGVNLGEANWEVRVRGVAGVTTTRSTLKRCQRALQVFKLRLEEAQRPLELAHRSK